MFPYSIVKNLSSKVIDEVARFIKRDYLEMRHIKEINKVKNFYEVSCQRSVDRIKTSLISYNQEYGIIVGNKEIVPSKTNIFWIIEAIDSYENFANNIPYWGVYVAVVEKKEGLSVKSISYFLPFLDEFFYCGEEQGCFLNDYKLNIRSSSKCLVGSGNIRLKKRNFGSELLNIFYCASDRLNVCKLPRNDFINGVARLVVNESKGFIFEAKEILIGNEIALNYEKKYL